MLYAFGFERVGVVVSDLNFVDPTPTPGQEGAERGVRLEVRLFERGELKGSIYSAQPIGIERPIWRADLLEAVASAPRGFDRTHHHPAFTGWEPGHRVFVPELSADPLGWVAARLCDLDGLLHEAGVDAGEADPTDAGALRDGVHVESRVERAWCQSCGGQAAVKDRPQVELVDLPCFGRPTRLVWRKHRWCCRGRECEAGSWTIIDDRIAPPRAAMTDRAGRWCTEHVGRFGRTVAEVARELGCDWHTVNDAVIAYGSALIDEDTNRIGDVAALGLDETLFCRRGPRRRQEWCTSIVDVSAGRHAQLLDIVAGRSAAGPSAWLEARPDDWRDAIGYGVLDLSGPYRKTFNDALPDATQVADPFHVVKLANAKLDECRRRVQNETLGHRGRKGDPLYRSRRLLTKGHERLDEHGHTKLMGLLEAGDPRGEVRMTWHAKETLRGLYDLDDPAIAAEYLDELIADMADHTMPTEVRSLSRTLRRWREQILAWHEAFVSNGPTEAVNNLIKRIKRVGFGFRKFAHYRIRVLLYAGRPNWDLLATVNPAEIR